MHQDLSTAYLHLELEMAGSFGLLVGHGLYLFLL